VCSSLVKYTIFKEDFLVGEKIELVFLKLQVLEWSYLGEDLADISLLLVPFMTTFRSYLVLVEIRADLKPSDPKLSFT